jgi:predicted hydrolase (HD superfamily)
MDKTTMDLDYILHAIEYEARQGRAQCASNYVWAAEYYLGNDAANEAREALRVHAGILRSRFC